MDKVIFVSGIDTDCGKTFITGNLAKELLRSGKNVITHKIIQTGCVEISEDIIEHRKIMGVDLFPEDIEGLTCPYVMSFPSSPHLASEIDKVDIDIKKISDSINSLANRYELVLTEGAGGLMVPLKKNYLTIDFIKDNGFPLILVTSSKLGSINHTLLSLEACKRYGINLQYVFYNQFPDHDKVISDSTYKFLDEYLKIHFPETVFTNGLQTQGSSGLLLY